ncbi:hypothetical protein Anapl_06946 [Anas platyrhynchos]|uniref:Uncharacterized protein n=1 Tax=Anas platyrhynchos TaxID=8839 RepID=R0JYG7_ANAPL|nr:hypothetical protein Anapl_06946 [Anas platyrhynchos]
MCSWVSKLRVLSPAVAGGSSNKREPKNRVIWDVMEYETSEHYILCKTTCITNPWPNISKNFFFCPFCTGIDGFSPGSEESGVKVLLEHTRHLGSFAPLVQHKAPSPAARCHITAVSSAAGTARAVPGAHNSPSFAEKQLLLLQPKPRAQLRRQTSHCRQPLPTAAHGSLFCDCGRDPGGSRQPDPQGCGQPRFQAQLSGGFVFTGGAALGSSFGTVPPLGSWQFAVVRHTVRRHQAPSRLQCVAIKRWQTQGDIAFFGKPRHPRGHGHGDECAGSMKLEGQ